VSSVIWFLRSSALSEKTTRSFACSSSRGDRSRSCGLFRLGAARR
jgi:hypothetical protein